MKRTKNTRDFHDRSFSRGQQSPDAPQEERGGKSNTQGVFSDVLRRQLPNGWRFGLPNEIYRTADGTMFNLVGIPLSLPMPTWPLEKIRQWPGHSRYSAANDIPTEFSQLFRTAIHSKRGRAVRF
jgi:hypothetical protein